MIDFSRLSEEEKLFCSHIDDLIQRCEKKYIPQFTYFLDERQALLAQQVLERWGWEGFRFYGGYEAASRCVLGIFPPYNDHSVQDYPIQPLTFSYRGEDSLTHRDFLGSLMALQIKREALGDILVGKGQTVVFASPTVASFIQNELKKVGSVGIKISEGIPDGFSVQQEFQEISGTVSSLRLDCVVSLATRLSREKSAQIIRSGLVMLDFASCQQVDRLVKEGDRMSIRGYGKYNIGSSDGFSKKGRIRLTVQKYT